MLGKFAPLHRGHQDAIEEALRQTDHLIVVVHGVSDTSVPIAIRAGWIRKLYPSTEVMEALDSAAVEDFPSLLGEREITHFFSGEPDGPGMDDDLFTQRSQIHPIVYRDLIARVVFLGAPSTGKSTLVTLLADKHRTVWMPEYGREYWEKNQVDRRLTLEQLYEIGEGHRQIEDEKIREANRFLFVDTEAIVTRIFSLHYHGLADERLDRFADESATRYDIFFLCDDDIPYHDTPERSGEGNRALFQSWIRDDLARRRIPYITLAGSVEQRLAKAERVLDGYRKYMSIAEHLINSEVEGRRLGGDF